MNHDISGSDQYQNDSQSEYTDCRDATFVQDIPLERRALQR